MGCISFDAAAIAVDREERNSVEPRIFALRLFFVYGVSCCFIFRLLLIILYEIKALFLFQLVCLWQPLQPGAGSSERAYKMKPFFPVLNETM